MKKCVRCGAKYNDSVLKCPKCQLYLIQDVSNDPGPESQVDGNTGRPKRGRVEPVDRTDLDGIAPAIDVDLRGSSRNHGGFRPSTETVRGPINHFDNSGSINYRRNRNRNLRRTMRWGMVAIRYIVPLVLILLCVLFIVSNWSVIYDIIQCCIVGGIIGGMLLTWLSASGHHYTPEATIVGVIGGMVVACLLTYNVFGVASGLAALLVAMGPCIIIIVAIFYMIRGGR